MKDGAFYIDTLTVISGNITVEGYTVRPQTVYMQAGGRTATFMDTGNIHMHTLPDKTQATVHVQKSEFRVVNGDMITFHDEQGRRLLVHTRRFSGVGDIYGSYRVENNSVIRRLYGSLRISQRTRTKLWWYELVFILRLIVDVGFLRALHTLRFERQSFLRRVVKSCAIILESLLTMPSAILFRILVKFSRSHQRPIWIISDRGMSAGDNGEALFRYITKQKSCPADVYFAISKKSKDYKRMKAVGPVLNYGSFKYKMKFTQSNKIISSHADVEVTNPFRRQIDRFADLLHFDFVFLQHGIIRHDLSKWLNRYEQNIKLFITSARKEYESLFKYPYYYAKKNVLLSGMPRYDLLENNPKHKIIFAPTYRANLLKGKTDKYGQRIYDITFKDSEYYKFYSALINDDTLLEVMRKNNFTGELYVHPNFAAQINDFRGNDTVKVMSYPYDYRKALDEGSLLVSDFSSIVLDFAYLKKPVIYSQFDADTFYEGHSYKESDFFNDGGDGFGPICHDLEQTIDEIVKLIGGLTINMADVYQKRVDKFFAYADKNNCQRVYRALLEDRM